MLKLFVFLCSSHSLNERLAESARWYTIVTSFVQRSLRVVAKVCSELASPSISILIQQCDLPLRYSPRSTTRSFRLRVHSIERAFSFERRRLRRSGRLDASFRRRRVGQTRKRHPRRRVDRLPFRSVVCGSRFVNLLQRKFRLDLPILRPAPAPFGPDPLDELVRRTKDDVVEYGVPFFRYLLHIHQNDSRIPPFRSTICRRDRPLGTNCCSELSNEILESGDFQRGAHYEDEIWWTGGGGRE